MTTKLENLNDSLFQSISEEEAAMALGGQGTVHTFKDNGDGTYTYMGEDLIIREQTQEA